MDPTELLPKDTATTRTVRDIFLIDFYEKKTQETQLVDITQVNKWSKYCEDKEISGIFSMFSACDYVENSPHNFVGNVHPLFKEEISRILDILAIGNGKISMCGLVTFDLEEFPALKFYFHSCTILEANDLLVKSLKILEANDFLIKSFQKLGDMGKSTIRDFLFMNISSDVSSVRLISFCLDVYDNKGSMLRNIGPSIDRQGWNPVDGYFGTISGGMTSAMKSCPFDLEYKYAAFSRLFQNGVNILFHGFDRPYVVNNPIRTINGFIQITDNGRLDVMERKETAELSKGWTKVEQTRIKLEEIISSSPMKLFKDKYIRATEPNSWLLNYIPYVVGVDDNRYVAINNIAKEFRLGKDILGLLCFYLLTVEVNDAKQRCFSIGN